MPSPSQEILDTFLPAVAQGLSRARVSGRQRPKLPVAAAAVAVCGARALPALLPLARSAPFMVEGPADRQWPPVLGLLPRVTLVGDGPLATTPD